MRNKVSAIFADTFYFSPFFTYKEFSNIIRLKELSVDTNNSDFLPMLSISREKAVKNLEEAKNYITLDLKNIASILSSYHPLEIARMSVWEARRVERQSKDLETKSIYRLLPILIQSVLVSDLFFASSNNRDVRSRDWQRVLSLAEDVARKLSRYIDNLVIINLSDGRVSREDIMDYRAALYEQFFPSEKTHDIIRREKAVATSSFEWDGDAVEKTFSVSPERLVKDLFDISDSSLDVIDKLVDDIASFKEEVEKRVEKVRSSDPSLSEDGAMHMVYRDSDIRAENARLSGMRDDFDLFRPEFLSSITNETMDRLSSELGKVDMLSLLFDEGLWSATCYPFIKLSGMYFTFVARYLLAIYQRFSFTTMHLGSRVSASADNALSSLFTATDVVGVYSFNGRKVDVEVLSSLGEINLVSEPELWQQRMKRRSSEMEAKPQLGHTMLIVNPDGEEEIERLGDDIFLTSVLYLLKIRDDNNLRQPFYDMLFGPLNAELPDDAPFEDDVFEDEDAFTVEEMDAVNDDLVLDELEEEDDYLNEGDDEEDDLESYSDPYEAVRKEPSEEERLLNERMYESNHERILSELEKDVENSEYQVVDEDEIESDEDQDNPVDDYEDPDQLNFLDLLDDYDTDEEDQLEEKEETELVEADGLEEDDEVDEEALPSSDDVNDKKSVSGILDLSDFDDEDPAEELYSQAIDEMEQAAEADEEEREEADPPSESVLLEEEKKENVLKAIEESPTAMKEDRGLEKKNEEPDPSVSSLDDEDILLDEDEKDAEDEYLDLIAEDEESEVNEEDLPELEELSSPEANDHGFENFSKDGDIVLEYDDGTDDDNEGTVLDPSRYSKTIIDIARKVEGDASSLFSFLEKEDASVIDYFDAVIRQSWEKQAEDGRDKMFSVFEYDMSLLLSKGRIYDDLRLQELMNNAGAVMYSQGKSRWNALLIYINKDYEVESAKMIVLTKESFSPSNWKIVTNIGDALIARKNR